MFRVNRCGPTRLLAGQPEGYGHHRRHALRRVRHASFRQTGFKGRYPFRHAVRHCLKPPPKTVNQRDARGHLTITVEAQGRLEGTPTGHHRQVDDVLL